MPAEQCKGAGDVFVSIWPFSEIAEPSKTTLKNRLNNLASVCMYSNGQAKICDEEGGSDEGEVFYSSSFQGERQPMRPAETAQPPRTRGRGEGGGTVVAMAPSVHKCCQFYETGTKIRGVQKIKFGIKLTFVVEGVNVEAEIEFDLNFSSEATGVIKNWLCPKVCQKDTTSATVDLIITGKYKPKVSVPAFGFDAGVSLDLDLRLGMGDYLNTCDLP